MKTVTIRDNGLGDCEVQDALDAKPGEYVPIAEVRKLTAQRDALLAELQRLEWGDEDDDIYSCPTCHGIHPDDDGSGHKSGCTLDAAIANATDETPAAPS